MFTEVIDLKTVLTVCGGSGGEVVTALNRGANEISNAPELTTTAVSPTIVLKFDKTKNQFHKSLGKKAK